MRPSCDFFNKAIDGNFEFRPYKCSAVHGPKQIKADDIGGSQLIAGSISVMLAVNNVRTSPPGHI